MTLAPDHATPPPAYGASGHYDDAYFRWQDSGVAIKIRYKSELFGAHIAADDVVLDFGCAGGSLISSLRCARRIGIEINPAAREAAKRKGVETYATLADAPAGVADVIISSHTLEHLVRPFDALRELLPKLKPGGKLVLLLPIDNWRTKYNPTDVNRHLYTWTPLLLGHLLDEAGYDIDPADITVLRHALMRGFERLDSVLPRPAFDASCRVWAYLRHSLEIVAVARPRA